MEDETNMIDFTPAVLKTAAGRAHVDAAMNHFSDTSYMLANAALNFLDTWAITISNAHPELRDDLEDLKAAAKARHEAQNALLDAVSGR